MKRAGELLMMLLLAFSLSACPGKKGDSNGSAATPDSTKDEAAVPSTVGCQWSWEYNNYVDSKNRICTPSEADLNSTNYCHNYIYNWQTNTWVNKKGKTVKCVQGYIDFQYFQPYQTVYYGYTQANCAVYGYGWYPMQFGSGLVCVKQSYVNYYFPGYNLYNTGSSYYPTTCRYGVDCQSRCGGFSAGGNMGGVWFGGTLGMCL